METNDSELLSSYMTVEELARETKRSIWTIRRWMAIDECPPITRLGRVPLFRREAVKAWLLKQEAA